jgi:predicted glycosyltransferase
MENNGRLAFFSSDSYGLAHVVRNARIAANATRMDPAITALIITGVGGEWAPPLSDGCDYLRLPSFVRLPGGHHRCLRLRVSYEELRSWRGDLTAAAVQGFSPMVFVSDHLTANIRIELESTLRTLSRWPKGPWRILGFDDILNHPDVVKREWVDSGLLEFAAEQYDEVWVYGEREVYDWNHEYQLPAPFARRLRHVGYLARRVSAGERSAIREAVRRKLALSDGPLVLVTAGGGHDALPLVDRYLSAIEAGLLDRGIQTLIVTGSLMPEKHMVQIVSRAAILPQVRVASAIDDFADHLVAADAIVSMAGCTLGEIAAAGTPVLTVGRLQWPSSQQVRARVMSNLGLGETVPPEKLSGEFIVDTIRHLLERGARAFDLPFSGFDVTASRLLELARCA